MKTRLEIKRNLAKELDRLQYLGFDSISQAMQAILQDDNFDTTWDVSNDDAFMNAAIEYRHNTFEMIRGVK